MLGNGSDDDDLGFGGMGDDDDLGFGGVLPEGELPVIPGIEEESKSDITYIYTKLQGGIQKPIGLFGGRGGFADGPSEAMEATRHDLKAKDPEREPV